MKNQVFLCQNGGIIHGVEPKTKCYRPCLKIAVELHLVGEQDILDDMCEDTMSVKSSAEIDLGEGNYFEIKGTRQINFPIENKAKK